MREKRKKKKSNIKINFENNKVKIKTQIFPGEGVIPHIDFSFGLGSYPLTQSNIDEDRNNINIQKKERKINIRIEE